MARCTHMFVYVVSWLDFAVLLVPDTTSHHFVWFPYPEQPEGVMVLVRLCVSRETWHSTRFPAAFLYSYRTRRLRQCNRNPGIFFYLFILSKYFPSFSAGRALTLFCISLWNRCRQLTNVRVCWEIPSTHICWEGWKQMSKLICHQKMNR